MILKSCGQTAAGLSGNVKHIASLVKNTRFSLVDHSETSLEFAKEKLLGSSDERNNSFDYLLSMDTFADESVDLILTIQVLEHISEYKSVMDLLWSKIKPGGILMLSVPVRGIRDTNRQHINKFTIKSMFRILSTFSEIVHIASRTYSKRTGRTTTAYFYVRKPKP
ncbi:MAG: class I SAM-dependent methyltransferase [Bacteroidetes bacterium]|nr:class I SAM-dependent methyltransferase [Bacteroidota bacterium]